MEDTLQHALKLAAEGFWVFPCAPMAKLPAFKGWKQAATRDPGQITAWFKDTDYNVGIFTEKFGDSESLVVIDVDQKKGKDGYAELLKLECEGFDLPVTRVHHTPSGGRHLIFRVPRAVRSSVDALGTGLDVRSAGGLIVGPGSRTNDGAYRSAGGDIAAGPDWLCDRAGGVQSRGPVSNVSADVDSDRAHTRSANYLKDEAPPSIEGQGGNANAYKVAARVKDFGVDRDTAAGLMLEHWNERCEPPWTADELGAIVDHAYKYGNEPQGVAAPENDFAPIFPDSRWNIQRISELRSEKHPALIDGILGECGIAGIIGVPGAAKTFNAVHLGGCVAADRPWFGRKVSPGPCLYIDTDGGLGTLKRFVAWREYHSAPDAPLFVLNGDAFNVRAKKDLEELAAWVRGAADILKRRFKLIILDTLNQSAGGMDENAAKDMAQAIEGMKWLRDKLGVAVIFVHHLGKDASKGARGHSSLNAAVDVELLISGKTIKHGKPPRHYEPFGAMGFRLEPVALEDGDSTCVVAPQNARAVRDFSEIHIKPESVAGRALTVFEDLWIGRRDGEGILVDAWRDDFVRRHYSENRPVGRTSFRRAHTTLLTARRISQEGDHAFLSN
ncbi:MAG TPA: bifunctional DNA primase/polymerase [Rhizomicrobium sp.]|nr:bifunctional DNA primase/polymerase [Rhizomicrobium sp.]